MVLGSPVPLACALFSLVIGDSVASNVLQRTDIVCLGISIDRVNSTQSAVLMRRMASSRVISVLLSFIGTSILDDLPRIFVSQGSQSNDPKAEAIKSATSGSAFMISSLALSAASSLLNSANLSSNATRSSQSPRVALARLLNSLSVRLCAFYDAILSMEPNAADSSSLSEGIQNIQSLLARILSNACAVLTTASSPHSGSSKKNDIESRDSFYGVICTLSRCRFSMAVGGALFNCGGSNAPSSKNTSTVTSSPPHVPGGSNVYSISTATAALLFGCAANEEESLRPRAVAALDALLGAYIRMYKNQQERMSFLDYGVSQQTADTSDLDSPLSDNPWQDISTQKNSSDSHFKMKTDEKTSHFDGVSRSLTPLLWSAAQSSQPKASRLAASRWSDALLRHLDLSQACHILCFLAGDSDTGTASIAKAGLGILSPASIDPRNKEVQLVSENILPDFNDIVSTLFDHEGDSVTKSSWRPTFFDFPSAGKGATLRFGLNCLLNDLYGGEDSSVDIFISALSKTLKEFVSTGITSRTNFERDSTDLLEECAICLAGCLSTSQHSRSLIVKPLSSFNLRDATTLAISAPSSKARRYLAEACGYLYEDSGIWKMLTSPCSKQSKHDGDEDSEMLITMKTCCEKLEGMHTDLFHAGEAHGAAFLGSRCVRAFRMMGLNPSTCGVNKSPDTYFKVASRIISSLGRGSLNSDEAVGKACSGGIAIALSYDDVDAPVMDERLHPSTASALCSLDTALRKYGNGDHTNASRASSLARAAGVALAASTSGSGLKNNTVNDDNSHGAIGVGPVRLKCVDALFNLIGSSASQKDLEINIVAGEALVRYADAYSPPGVVWSSPTISKPDEYDEAYAVTLPPHKHVVYRMLEKEIKVSSPLKRTATAPALLAIVGNAAGLVNKNIAFVNRVFVKEITNNLIDFQSALITLLADPKSKQLSRESCCLGLAACYGLATAVTKKDNAIERDSYSQALNERLLRAFGQTTNFGGSAFMETRSQETARRTREAQANEGGVGAATEMIENVEVGGTAGLGEAALGAYREMAGAALSLGRPDVLYSLMLLSVCDPIWSTSGFKERYSGASLLGSGQAGSGGTNVTEIRDALRPHLSKLVPKLLRGCHDPNKQVREQMTALWNGLTGGGAESRAIVDQYFLPTIDILVRDATNKLWRARVGACGAISEIIVGRTWTELGGGDAITNDDDAIGVESESLSSASIRLLRLWRVTMRALDDVRLTVRESAETLANSMKSLTIRLCDPSIENVAEDKLIQRRNSIETKKENERNSLAATATTLRWLMKHGLNQPCVEATGICISCLLGVVDVAKPTTLQPVLPELIGSLAMAISGLEPAALNYLQVRMSGEDANRGNSTGGGYDRLERLRLQLSESGPIAKALRKALDIVRFLPPDGQKTVVPHLDNALRFGAGFATRVAAADSVSTLCSTCPAAFKGQSNTSTLTNPTVRLLRALYFASERERGSATRDKMAHALGSLASLAPGYAVRSLATRACEKYSRNTGSNDDPAARRAAAAALRSIAVRASQQFSDGGNADVWCKRVLPMAFLGLRDEDKKVAALWKDVWEEGSAAAVASDRPSSRTTSVNESSFGGLTEEIILPHLIHASIEALNDVAWSRRIAACGALTHLADLNILAPIPRALQQTPNNNKADKELMTRACRRARASCAALTSCIKLLTKNRAWTGKAELVKCTVKIAGKWSLMSTGKKNIDSLIWGLYGDDVSNEQQSANSQYCTFVPVLIEEGQNDHLFLQDSWFATEDMVQITEEENDAVETNNDHDIAELSSNDDRKQEDRALMNLDDSEKILSDEMTPTTEDEQITDDKNEQMETVTFSGLCRFLMEQSMRSSTITTDHLPYRAASFQGLAQLLNSIPGTPITKDHAPLEKDLAEKYTSYRRFIYRNLAPELISFIESDGKEKQPPVIIARSIDSLAAAMWEGIGEVNPKNDVLACEDVSTLAKLIHVKCSLMQPAWTVREAAAMAGANLVSKACLEPLRRHETIQILFDCAVQASIDKKFWKVRLSGLRLLYSLVCRAGKNSYSKQPGVRAGISDSEKQLMLEAMLPLKEKILKLLKMSLADSEANVTSVASEIFGAMSWWP